MIQEGEIRRVGESTYRRVDVRVVAATNARVREAVKAGRFREDLFYRLNVVPIEVPRLADRRDDIPLLANVFLRTSCDRIGKEIIGCTDEAMRLLRTAPWKGNVRELENTIEKVVVLAEDARVDAAVLTPLLSEAERPPESGAARGAEFQSLDPIPTLAEFGRGWRDSESEYLERLVTEVDWNVSAASRLAGIRNRNNLISRLKKHGLRRPTDDDS